MAKSEFRFFHALRVRWAETDAQGVVFNGHYLLYADVAITEYWRVLGLAYPTLKERMGVDFYVVKSTVEYRAPAHYDDELEVGVRVGRMGNSSLQFLLEIYRQDTLLSQIEVINVATELDGSRSKPIPAELRQRLEAFELVDSPA